MSMVSKRQANFSSPGLDYAAATAGLERAHTAYCEASQRLFELCYSIQLTGLLPDPVCLTQAIVAYREARRLAEALAREAALAAEEENIAGAPVRPR
jgi:hypothetical protein